VAVLLPGGRCCVVRSASAADRLGIATSGSADAAGAWHPVVRPVLGVVPGLCVVLDRLCSAWRYPRLQQARRLFLRLVPLRLPDPAGSGDVLAGAGAAGDIRSGKLADAWLCHFLLASDREAGAGLVQAPECRQ